MLHWLKLIDTTTGPSQNAHHFASLPMAKRGPSPKASSTLDASRWLLAASRTRSPNTPHTRRMWKNTCLSKGFVCLPHASRVRQASSRYTGQPWNHSEAGMTFFLFCWPFFFFWLPWRRPKHAHNLSTVGIINDYYIPPSILRLISIIIRDLGIIRLFYSERVWCGSTSFAWVCSSSSPWQVSDRCNKSTNLKILEICINMRVIN